MSSLLALAAAALLVCARADALDIVELEYPHSSNGRRNKDDREPQIQFPSDLHIVNNTLEMSQIFNPNDDKQKSPYTDNDNDSEIHPIPSYRQDNAYDTEVDRGLDHVAPNDHQDKIYNEFLKKKRRIIPNKQHVKPNGELPNGRQGKAYGPDKKTELPLACLYDGRWHSNGAAVSTREECLSCVCAAGALSCRRRACAALPDPLPPRCHVRHRRDVCCPELHCPDGVQLMELGASARSESGRDEAEDLSATPVTAKNVCVEGGSVFAAGSALAARVACEQCFCLRGARHCVRPACLPPPPHCAPRPAAGACCPQRYYCHSATGTPDQHHGKYDCLVSGEWVAEGAAVGSRGNCSACFCLRGQVRCQALRCAPALAGCRALLARGACCAHQYVCDRHHHSLPQTGTQAHVNAAPVHSPMSTRYDERMFHSSNSGKPESTTKKILTSLYTLKHTSFASATKNHLITTTKVKRKTDEPPVNSSTKPEQTTNTTSNNITTTQKPMSAAKLIAMPEFSSTNSEDSHEKTTEQPEGTVKIVINGTINCTAELSSTSLPLNIMNDTEKQVEVLPRVPIVDVEAQTYSPNDIITDRNVNGGFDEEDTFTINVTSSLMTNTSHSTSRPVATGPKISIPVDLVEALNSSKKKKGEYDYDYPEPTLPPSLPNLKIIPFVAADAVVDDEPTKETLTYPILEREDKFPVYYPTTGTKDTKFPDRREDTYQPTQYPVFLMGKVEPSYPPISHEVDVMRERFPERNGPGGHEYTVSASLGGQSADVKTVTQLPPTSTTFALETPAVNLFSPPVETEGGFLPKGSGVIDEYFGVYPSTPSGPAVPHLTTSMQLDVIKDIEGECLVEGQRVAGGQSIVLGCQLCTCGWVELTCERRPCAHVSAPCRRLPVSNHSTDPCCGDLDCTKEINTTTVKPAATSTVTATNATVGIQNVTKDDVPKTTFQPFIPMPTKTDTAHKTNAKVNNSDEASVYNKTSTSQVNTETVPKTNKTASPTNTSVNPTPEVTTITTTTITTTTAAPVSQVEDTSFEEEEEDDDDDGEFSFGSVLKLLLSDSYETTTAPSKKPTTRAPTRLPPITVPVHQPSTNTPSTTRPIEETAFKPLPPRQTYSNLINTVNRIDHLVLGEATAIKRTTQRPITNKTTKRPVVYDRPTPQPYERPTSQTSETTERRPVMQEDSAPFTPVAPGPRPPSLGGLPSVGAGLLKLAGCNIYGRMYRVGRIITELSTPCTECWCTELGVQCKPLNC